MPKDGTIVKTDGMEGSMAQAGNPIAYAYNLDDLYITANVDEKTLLILKKVMTLMLISTDKSNCKW